ncbi:MAG TPA: 3-deoxy-7-phosphoheptulonate synthase [Myxococcota bacterium]|nr:3-deoxy-7-phosphoheptulonate synthase [Myxococcota bacterium]
MTAHKISTDDLHIASFFPLITPDEVQKKFPISQKSIETVYYSRQAIADIIAKRDPRKIIIVGPCSIHDPASALEYARLLKELAQEVKDKFLLVMRAYFEKPRTTVGWKGLINDPALDNSFNINEGLAIARKLLLDITSSGLPVGTESLEPISPQYIAELISWTAIGARTTESQTHRELASGLSSPVGFKNNTDGNVEVAINAIRSAALPHHFLGIDHFGQTSIVATKGNPYCHLILRGGKDRPNYDTVSVNQALASLREAKLMDSLVIDCSHDNSMKDFRNQPNVFFECIHQIARGNAGIVGLMLESHIYEGQQSLSNNLRYGISITDGCISFEKTCEIIRNAYREFTLAKIGS